LPDGRKLKTLADALAWLRRRLGLAKKESRSTGAELFS
jgi:hypothetical protein